MSADIVVEDREGEPVLLIEIKSRPVGEAQPQERSHRLLFYASRLKVSSPTKLFGMIVDPERIEIYEIDRQGTSMVVDSLPTVEMLRHYDHEFAGSDTSYGSRRVFGLYLETLVKAWLEDLTDHWRPGTPPSSAAMEKSGLLGRLEGGTIIEEGLVRDDPLR